MAWHLVQWMQQQRYCRAWCYALGATNKNNDTRSSSWDRHNKQIILEFGVTHDGHNKKRAWCSSLGTVVKNIAWFAWWEQRRRNFLHCAMRRWWRRICWHCCTIGWRQRRKLLASLCDGRRQRRKLLALSCDGATTTIGQAWSLVDGAPFKEAQSKRVLMSLQKKEHHLKKGCRRRDLQSEWSRKLWGLGLSS